MNNADLIVAFMKQAGVSMGWYPKWKCLTSHRSYAAGWNGICAYGSRRLGIICS